MGRGVNRAEPIEKLSRKIVLGILTLKDLLDKDLPDYMKTAKVIRGTQSLNHFIAHLLDQPVKTLEESQVLRKHTQMSHPLDDVLDWRL